MPADDESDSHRHDRVNYSIPKLGKGLSPSQSRGVVELMNGTHIGNFVNPKTPKSSAVAEVVCTKKDLSILKSPCSNPMAWRIERIFADALDLCTSHFANGSKCNAKLPDTRGLLLPLHLLEFRECRSLRILSKCNFDFALESYKLVLWDFVLDQLRIILLSLFFGL